MCGPFSPHRWGPWEFDDVEFLNDHYAKYWYKRVCSRCGEEERRYEIGPY